jgi:hypothetical protein
MMIYECGMMNLGGAVLFGGFDGCDKNGGQFVGFFLQLSQFFNRHDMAFSEKFQPISGFIQFLQAAFHFVDEISRRFRAARFPVLRSDRGAAAQDLFSDHLCLTAFRQGLEKLDDP